MLVDLLQLLQLLPLLSLNYLGCFEVGLLLDVSFHLFLLQGKESIFQVMGLACLLVEEHLDLLQLLLALVQVTLGFLELLLLCLQLSFKMPILLFGVAKLFGQ